MRQTVVSSLRSGAHDPEGRRRAVLAAARRLFAANGYAQTSVRAIAAAAGVNQALVVTYFGGKEALFMEVVGGFTISREALTGGVDGMGARLARMYVDRWENMADDDPRPALARSALSHEGSARLLSSALAEQHAPLREVLGDSDEGQARMAMVQCLIGGMVMERYIHRLEPARSLPAEVFEAALASTLQHALNGPLGGVPSISCILFRHQGTEGALPDLPRLADGVEESGDRDRTRAAARPAADIASSHRLALQLLHHLHSRSWVRLPTRSAVPGRTIPRAVGATCWQRHGVCSPRRATRKLRSGRSLPRRT
jgi:AcrR family transcriptional regulator